MFIYERYNILRKKKKYAPCAKIKGEFTMKTEINFRKTSRLVPFLKTDGSKLTSLDRYPTSRNTKIWVNDSDSKWSTTYHLVSYECIPAYYIHREYIAADTLSIRIFPEDLTPTTRKHIYAFIRQFVPAKQAQVIINTVRITFALPPTSKSEYTDQPLYEMMFDVFPD